MGLADEFLQRQRQDRQDLREMGRVHPGYRQVRSHVLSDFPARCRVDGSARASLLAGGLSGHRGRRLYPINALRKPQSGCVRRRDEWILSIERSTLVCCQPRFLPFRIQGAKSCCRYRMLGVFDGAASCGGKSLHRSQRLCARWGCQSDRRSDALSGLVGNDDAVVGR